MLLTVILSILFYSFLFTLLRFGFFLAFRNETLDLNSLLESFYIGFKFDLKLVVGILLPYIIYLYLSKKYRTPILKKIAFIVSTIITSVFILVYYTDFGHYAYLKTRVTAPTLIDNIGNPMIALEMLWQSYPLILIILSYIFINVLWQYLFKKFLFDRLSWSFKNIKAAALSRVILFIFLGILLYGKFSYYPLRWSDAYFSKNNFLSELTLNPVLNLVETFRNKDLKFDKIKVQEAYPLVADYLGVEELDQEKLNFKRKYNEGSVNFKRANVIVILMESLGSDKTSLSSNPLDPTPYLSKIADKSVYYSQFFTPTEATARGVFATLTSVPDVVSTKSASRNPRLIDHLTVMDQFHDYHRYYFLGGSASWANIRSLITSNISGVKIFEEGNYEYPRVDVWGISDHDLFQEANKQFLKSDKPFVAMIQTAGFHRPYTIPEIRNGFVPRSDIALTTLKKHGFDSLEQYNSIRLQDYALGKFFEKLESSEYGKNTIVAIMGDHGLPSPESIHVPAGYYKHRLVNHHVPLLLYFPGALEPRVESEIIGSQVDVFPTIADALGMPFKISSMGRSLLRQRKEENNKAFIFSWHQNPRLIGLIDKEFYYEDGASYQKLFKYKSTDPVQDYSSEYPEKFLELQKLTRGLYESSLYLLENNKKD